MKLFLSFLLICLLAGCQLLNKQENSENISNKTTAQAQNIASVSEINQVLVNEVELESETNTKDKVKAFDPEAASDIWQRLRQQFSFSYQDNQRIAKHRKWYLKHPKAFNRIIKRSQPFLHYIVTELEANNMPLEIALLPIVESAFDPFAYSHGSASGMWQFVANTGKHYGMKQNWWYDGRRDVVASTSGAIEYLKYLHQYFNGDWMLALAAYNSGEGRVKRAVRKNKKKNKATDFWSLDLPKETRDYIPKLLAIVDIVKHAKQHNFALATIENKAVIKAVHIGSQVDLAKAATLAEISLNELQQLNPGFNRWATDPEGPHSLLLPINKVANFKEKLAKLSANEKLSWQRYKIRSGDSLLKIARRFNSQVSIIKRANNLKSNKIRAGKFLLIPSASASLDSYQLSSLQKTLKKQNNQSSSNKLVHTVRSGDNLWDLSRKYKVSTRSIAKWNAISVKDTLKLGQKLVIWQATAKQKNSHKKLAQNKINMTNVSQVQNITYHVRKGDSFARIADKFNVKIKDIERWNNLNRHNYLQPGQKLKLSVDITNNI